MLRFFCKLPCLCSKGVLVQRFWFGCRVILVAKWSVSSKNKYCKPHGLVRRILFVPRHKAHWILCAQGALYTTTSDWSLFPNWFHLISSWSIQIPTRPKKLQGTLLPLLVFIPVHKQLCLHLSVLLPLDSSQFSVWHQADIDYCEEGFSVKKPY